MQANTPHTTYHVSHCRAPNCSTADSSGTERPAQQAAVPVPSAGVSLHLAWPDGHVANVANVANVARCPDCRLLQWAVSADAVCSMQMQILCCRCSMPDARCHCGLQIAETAAALATSHWPLDSHLGPAAARSLLHSRRLTSCAIKEARSGNFTPPGTIWVQGGAGLGWVWSGGPNLAPGPLGSVAGGPDRHRGWLLCPSSVPTASGR
jgi:hypothetical protein